MVLWDASAPTPVGFVGAGWEISNVLGRATAPAPVLAYAVGRVEGEMGRGQYVHGGHATLGGGDLLAQSRARRRLAVRGRQQLLGWT